MWFLRMPECRYVVLSPHSMETSQRGQLYMLLPGTQRQVVRRGFGIQKNDQLNMNILSMLKNRSTRVSSVSVSIEMTQLQLHVQSVEMRRARVFLLFLLPLNHITPRAVGHNRQPFSVERKFLTSGTFEMEFGEGPFHARPERSRLLFSSKR